MSSRFEPIPDRSAKGDFSFSKIEISLENEPFVKVDRPAQIISDMRYAKTGVPQAVSACYLRQTAYDRLLEAAGKLPRGYKFKIFDAWRPFSVQKWLYTSYRKILEERYSGLPPEQLETVIRNFVFPPTENPLTPPVHTTGGAVDLTIVDETGSELNMGSAFDDFTDRAHTDYFEPHPSENVAENRRMLYHIMTSCGFTNLPSEWWHFDFGTAFWAFYSGEPAKYSGVFTQGELFTMLS